LLAAVEVFMMSKRFITSLGVVSLVLSACGESKGGGTVKRNSPPKVQRTDNQPPSPILTTPAPNTPVCAANQKSIGANVVFLVDNSSSNGVTDCPGAAVVGRGSDASGQPTEFTRCSQETNRERAVLAAYDLLADVSSRDSAPVAMSQLSIVAFPAEQNNVTTVKIATNGWVSTRPAAENRAGLQTALQFTRQPYGATPVGTAIDAATSLFRGSGADGRSKVAVLINDGEPTDRDPAAVREKSEMLRAAGVELITVFVTNAVSRSSRQAAHGEVLRDYNMRSSPGTYYNAQRYPSFEAYLDDILGRNGRVPLMDAITNKVVPTCVDTPNSLCQRWKVELSSASEVTNVVRQIIRTRAVKCQ
jgi:hypothetical protein